MDFSTMIQNAIDMATNPVMKGAYLAAGCFVPPFIIACAYRVLRSGLDED